MRAMLFVALLATVIVAPAFGQDLYVVGNSNPPSQTAGTNPGTPGQMLGQPTAKPPTRPVANPPIWQTREGQETATRMVLSGNLKRQIVNSLSRRRRPSNGYARIAEARLREWASGTFATKAENQATNIRVDNLKSTVWSIHHAMNSRKHDVSELKGKTPDSPKPTTNVSPSETPSPAPKPEAKPGETEPSKAQTPGQITTPESSPKPESGKIGDQSAQPTAPNGDGPGNQTQPAPDTGANPLTQAEARNLFLEQGNKTAEAAKQGVAEGFKSDETKQAIGDAVRQGLGLKPGQHVATAEPISAKEALMAAATAASAYPFLRHPWVIAGFSLVVILLVAILLAVIGSRYPGWWRFWRRRPLKAEFVE